jgi:low temperature requirement protein LtrA
VSNPPWPGEASGQRSRFVRPQVLRNLTPEERSEERTSTPLELFFDLCFVVAVAALARGLHDEPNLGGTLRFLELFVPV